MTLKSSPSPHAVELCSAGTLPHANAVHSASDNRQRGSYSARGEIQTPHMRLTDGTSGLKAKLTEF